MAQVHVNIRRSKSAEWGIRMAESSPENGSRRLSYPRAPQVGQVDNYHSEDIFDPYRGLEDVNDPETAAWVAAQNGLTESFLAAVPAREEISARLAGLWNYPRLGVPFQRGGLWFQTRNSGLQNQPVLSVMDAPDAAGRVLVDCNELCAAGTVGLAAVSVSPDGSKAAYATSKPGSDWLTWRVADVASGADLGDVLEQSKGSTAEWRSDSSGFYYAAMQPPPTGREHRGGTSRR